MKILAIETSCDDTGIAVLEGPKGYPDDNFKTLSNVVASQIKIHKKYGGVFPALAKREHQKNLVTILSESLKKSGLLKKRNKTVRINSIKINKILEREKELAKKIIPFLKKYEKPNADLIAVTNGPGLEPCLWVGVNFAKTLSYFWNIPIVPINHIEAHILVNFLDNKDIKLPAIALVVSGGHTQIILIEKIGKYRILGETRDDAAGECFDKCAKILGLGYPGGPIISKLASQLKITQTQRMPQLQTKLPRPMINTKNYDFSFSGLKTAVLYADRKNTNKNRQYKKEMSAAIQQAIIDVLLKKTIKAVKDFKAKTLILGGGVSANSELKNQFKNKLNRDCPVVEFLVPKPNLSTDNGLMVAIAGFYHKGDAKIWQDIEVNANLRVK